MVGHSLTPATTHPNAAHATTQTGQDAPTNDSANPTVYARSHSHERTLTGDFIPFQSDPLKTRVNTGDFGEF